MNLPVKVTLSSWHLPQRWHDPLDLIRTDAPSQSCRIVLHVIAALVLILLLWAAVGQVDIIVSAEGKLTPQTLIKIVQPAEAGVLRELLVGEGDSVKAGQVLARLDSTMASADRLAAGCELRMQGLQLRRLQAVLHDLPMQTEPGDLPLEYAQVERQYAAQKRAMADSLEQERALLQKAEFDMHSASEILRKLERTVPLYRNAANAFADLAQDGYVPALTAADKNREMTEKEQDLIAQQATVAAARASIAAQSRKISQLQSSYKNNLQTELAEVRARITQLQPVLEKSQYRENGLFLKAPQDGVIKALMTTTQGAVLQPGAVLMTLVPKDEQLFADVIIRNEDVAFAAVGQLVRLKLAPYPFQRYGLLDGTVLQLSADATELSRTNGTSGGNGSLAQDAGGSETNTASVLSGYKARIALQSQTLPSSQGGHLPLTPGMQVVAEFRQGKRSVLDYLLSPVQKNLQEAGRER